MTNIYGYTMTKPTTDPLLNYDRYHIWHPYSSIGANHPLWRVTSAEGVRLKLADGSTLIDGMSSWWCAIHGYNHPTMNRALNDQLSQMSHVMFGGLTHDPAIKLAKLLVDLAPKSIETVFFSDSGSVAVEVSMKMAIQYWHDKQQPSKQKFLTVKNGYHGDTFGAMSVCDPVTGMHSLFSDTITPQYFVEAPHCGYEQDCSDSDIEPMKQALIAHNESIAAVIIEPIVQGAGGMRFYSPDYLKRVRELCDEFGVLLILDEIATGFGRTGKMFASEHAGIEPDIMCVGKALTGGYLTLAATMTTREISQTISSGNPGLFMHGPTFMANPLACAAGVASLELLTSSDWQETVQNIEIRLSEGLAPCRELECVEDVRVLGAIGVVELKTPVELADIQPKFVEQGIWVRPFGKLVYLMPPFIMSDDDLKVLTQGLYKVLCHHNG
ncbi:adenosylmethionine--8-amino-7-oxononanoate transaminase [Alkalimarinus sediminis]|uniref:Adenosylmethionine-8-amino-7-oxononanoate aminotransferase n=1 Tax=Alkalimarinus sediminis TaxID=1632866 RepID=A0A9E8HP91_9ALTE|nr:adenosylmethionine--8-amino-7-oxononanoate transaminase [Alkalimarinus sediminis]UZW76233.1 adenosylmethionine--8-amino-7-oxononanoate transaminase [Alkalimarinus sediminis]